MGLIEFICMWIFLWIVMPKSTCCYRYDTENRHSDGCSNYDSWAR